ncbi:MAG: MBL fold metallo-hydrolase [Acidobacteria bacterium]|nr:MAG: MBL fold metallo-hydrolase [Acidobacteriota bacterium]
MKIRDMVAPNPGPFTLSGTRTYLIDDFAVIDPGPAIDSHIEAIREAMPKLKKVFITHRHADHAPAALPLKSLTNAQIVAPAGGLEVIATPGHTSEHVCYLTPDRDLFTGDTILGEGTTAIFPPDGNMSDYIRSLEKLRQRNPRRIFPGHGPTRDDAIALIDEYIAHRMQREQQVIDALRAGAHTIPEMRRRIYRELDERLYGAAEVQIYAHLIKLQDEGRVDARDGAYYVSPRA